MIKKLKQSDNLRDSYEFAVLSEKINQIIGHLQAKEDTPQEQIDEELNDEWKGPTEEASKGEFESDYPISEPDYTHCGHCGVKFGDEDNPELHDINCWHYKQSNPPEHEDEWGKFDNYFKDLGFHNLPLHQDIRDEVKDYIKSNFVSKKKIKELVNQCGYVQHGKFIDKEDLLESLGLGD